MGMGGSMAWGKFCRWKIAYLSFQKQLSWVGGAGYGGEVEPSPRPVLFHLLHQDAKNSWLPHKPYVPGIGGQADARVQRPVIFESKLNYLFFCEFTSLPTGAELPTPSCCHLFTLDIFLTSDFFDYIARFFSVSVFASLSGR